MTLTVAGLTVTVATGFCITVTTAVAFADPLVAVIPVLPGASAVTSPDVDTLATVGMLDTHVIVRPVSTFPAESRAVATMVVELSCTSVAVEGSTVMLATVGGATGSTVIVADPLSQQGTEMQADAPACDVCGSITVRSGTCYKCLNCGESLGCS